MIASCAVIAAERVIAHVGICGIRHTIELTLPPAGQAIVSADRDHIEQVLNNLLSNAIKYSPGGGTVAVAVAAEDATVQVSVRDAGVGIPKAELESIFGLFYRSQEGDARHVGGMGLGLYISREIVVRHGGRIWAESPGEGQGTTVTFWLPGEPERFAGA